MIRRALAPSRVPTELGGGEAQGPATGDFPAPAAQVCDWEIWSLLFSRIVSMGSPVYAIGFLCVRH